MKMKQLRITKSITDRRDQTLDIYLKEIIKKELLSAAEEIELANQIKNGSKEALDLLVVSNLRFVISVAKQYQNQGIDLLDLISEGNIGLIKAAESFDESRGFRFISYAVHFIRQAMINALTENSRIVRLPINQVGILTKVKKATTDLEQILERQPGPDEISALSGASLEEVNLIISVSDKYSSLDEPIESDDEENAPTLGSTLESKNLDNDTDENLKKESLFIELRHAVNLLNEKEKTVISLFYGLDGEPYSLSEISEEIGLTRERVRQIKEKAIRKLRHESRNKNLKLYL